MSEIVVVFRCGHADVLTTSHTLTAEQIAAQRERFESAFSFCILCDLARILMPNPHSPGTAT